MPRIAHAWCDGSRCADPGCASRNGSFQDATWIRQLFFVALLILPASPALAQKTDVVHMDNGNRIVGEVKKLELGLLELSVDDIVDRLRIKWEHVARVTSDQLLEVELGDGTYHFGSLIEPATDGELRIQSVAGVFDVRLLDVVSMEPIENAFWRRLDANISAGISFTKASDILQFNLGFAGRYRTYHSLTDISLNSILTKKASGPSATNSDLNLTHYRYFGSRWFYRVDAGASRNDELGIDLRVNFGGGAGRRILQANRWLVLVSALVVGNRESTDDGREANNVEAAVDISVSGFRHDTPKLEVTSDLTIFFGLNNSDRYRVNFDGRISFELGVKDLFLDIGQVYYRFDNDPSLTATSTHDYGIVSGVRFKF